MRSQIRITAGVFRAVLTSFWLATASSWAAAQPPNSWTPAPSIDPAYQCDPGPRPTASLFDTTKTWWQNQGPLLSQRLPPTTSTTGPEEVWPNAPDGYGPPAMTLPPPPQSPANYSPAPGQAQGSPFDDPFEEHCGNLGQFAGVPPAVDTSHGFWEPYNGIMSVFKGATGLFHTPDDPTDDAHLLGKWTLMNFSAFAGFQGFQGQPDEKAGSNFGFHEGFNWSIPLIEDWGIGHQTGIAGVHSDLSGGSGLLSSRNQFFLTSGFYHRPVQGTGFQAGFAFDYMHDDWYVKMDLTQLRAETSWVGKVHEVGLMAAIHSNMDSRTSPITGNIIQWQALDQYLVFYRRRLHGVGWFRLWAGATDHGDGIFGGDGTSPLTTHWAFQTNYNVTFPRTDSTGYAPPESWGLSFNLVWYPGYTSPRSSMNPFRALFDVSDNTLFLVQQKGR